MSEQIKQPALMEGFRSATAAQLGSDPATVPVEPLHLVDGAKQGDMDAFSRLYDHYVGQVYLLCLRLTGDKALAEDATQEVFIQLWRKLANFNGRSRFSTWLHRVAANVTVSYMRKQRNWLARMLDIESSAAMHVVAAGCSSQVDLDSLVRRLPERARIVFVLHAIEGYRHEQVAELTNMAVGSSKAQFHRAKQLLKEWMSHD